MAASAESYNPYKTCGFGHSPYYRAHPGQTDVPGKCQCEPFKELGNQALGVVNELLHAHLHFSSPEVKPRSLTPRPSGLHRHAEWPLSRRTRHLSLILRIPS